jgi:hypothetical protein
MRNLLLIISSLLVSCSLLSAQQNDRSEKSSGDPGQTTVRGCLSPSALALTSDSGTTYELVGDSSQLGKLAGKEVSVTGAKGSASAISTGTPGGTGLSTSNPTAGTAPTIRVTAAKKISDHCGVAKPKAH